MHINSKLAFIVIELGISPYWTYITLNRVLILIVLFDSYGLNDSIFLTSTLIHCNNHCDPSMTPLSHKLTQVLFNCNCNFVTRKLELEILRCLDIIN